MLFSVEKSALLRCPLGSRPGRTGADLRGEGRPDATGNGV
jgi:hypothetical protein